MSGFKDDGDMDFIGDGVFGTKEDPEAIAERIKKEFLKKWQGMPEMEPGTLTFGVENEVDPLDRLQEIEATSAYNKPRLRISFDGEGDERRITSYTSVDSDGNTTTHHVEPVVTGTLPYRYGEDATLREIEDYIKSTYGEHYAGTKTGTQFVDLLFSEDDSVPAFKFTIGRYVHRFGKKAGYNRKDLFKAIHYLLLLLEYTKDKQKD